MNEETNQSLARALTVSTIKASRLESSDFEEHNNYETKQTALTLSALVRSRSRSRRGEGIRRRPIIIRKSNEEQLVELNMSHCAIVTDRNENEMSPSQQNTNTNNKNNMIRHNNNNNNNNYVQRRRQAAANCLLLSSHQLSPLNCTTITTIPTISPLTNAANKLLATTTTTTRVRRDQRTVTKRELASFFVTISSSFILLALLLATNNQIEAYSTANGGQQSGNQDAGAGKQQQQQVEGVSSSTSLTERVDHSSGGSLSSSGGGGTDTLEPSASSSQSSIVASLSSAVASAAAAAAVAAAQNSLSSSDARSLLHRRQSSSGNSARFHHLQQQQQQLQQQTLSHRPGLNLAMKIVADAIPEVPYHILHNMKKLDHAAPFYNVPASKMIGGSSGSLGNGGGKESGQSLLASALQVASASASGGSLEQLSNLFKSPIWKRLADGYGEFTSEFRSLFRTPSSHPIKGSVGGVSYLSPGSSSSLSPSSATTKLIRDISVPALLMLIASTLPNDWRPIRTRRKSLAPVDLAAQAVSSAAGIDPMLASASASSSSLQSDSPVELPNFSFLPTQVGAPFRSGSSNVQHNQNDNVLNSLGQLYNQQQQQQVEHQQQAARVSSSSSSSSSEINLQQPAENSGISSNLNGGGGGATNWISAAPTMSHNYPQHSFFGGISQQQQQQQQQASISRRIGDSPNSNLLVDTQEDGSGEGGEKPVKFYGIGANADQQQQQQQAGGLFSSLTSLPGNKLFNRLMNVNGNSFDIHDQMLLDGSFQQIAAARKPLMMRREQLNDQHKYSLLDMNESLQPKQSNKLFLNNLSTMGQTIAGLINNAAASPTLVALHSSEGSPGNSAGQLQGAARQMANFVDFGKRQNSQNLGPEQRDLTLLLPQSWREVVKRTMNNVHQQATSQWKSIEGQVTNWVQDKLKTFPVQVPASSSSVLSVPSVSSPTTITNGGVTATATGASIPNLIASVGSTAMNIFGLGNKQTSIATGGSQQTTGASIDLSPIKAKGDSGGDLSNKSLAGGQQQQPAAAAAAATQQVAAVAKGALVGMANMIVNTLTSSRSGQTTANHKHHQGEDHQQVAVGQYPTQSATGLTSSSSSSLSSLPTSSSSSTSAAVSSSMAASTASTAAAAAAALSSP